MRNQPPWQSKPSPPPAFRPAAAPSATCSDSSGRTAASATAASTRPAPPSSPHRCCPRSPTNPSHSPDASQARTHRATVAAGAVLERRQRLCARTVDASRTGIRAASVDYDDHRDLRPSQHARRQKRPHRAPSTRARTPARQGDDPIGLPQRGVRGANGGGVLGQLPARCPGGCLRRPVPRGHPRLPGTTTRRSKSRGRVSPLGSDTGKLAQDFINEGHKAVIVCIDPRALDASFAGRAYDEQLLADLPEGVDPCGENGEFHTFVHAGPMFASPIMCSPGDVVDRDGFVFCDLLPA